MDITYRKHQKEAISAVESAAAEYDRMRLYMACGTGKTITSIGIVRALNPALTLFLCPSLLLISQSLSVYRRFFSDAICLTVCSESSSDEDVVTTLDPDVIRDFVSSSGDQKFIFCTYQSFEKMYMSLDVTTVFDLAICDESHFVAGQGIDRSFSAVLRDENLLIRKRVFMTATPCNFDAVDTLRAQNDKDLVYSMDNEEWFGPLVYEYPLSRAIADGNLADYDLCFIGVTDEEVEKYFSHQTHFSSSSVAEVSFMIAAQKAYEQYGISHIVSYHGSCVDARRFSSLVQQFFPDVYSDYVQSQGMTVAEREVVLDHAENAQKSITPNVRCLGLGVDKPWLDAALFTSPKYSVSETIQCLGRVIRLDPSCPDKRAKIIIPLYYVDGLPDLNKDSFAFLSTLIEALRQYDDRFCERLRYMLSKGIAVSSSSSALKAVDLCDLPFSYFESIFDLVLSRNTDFSFWKRMAEYREFVSVNHCEPPKAGDDHERSLYRWSSRIRSLRKHGSLPLEYIVALDQISFVWDVRDQQWHDAYMLYVQFLLDHKRLPSTHSDDVEESARARWAHLQRTQKRQKKLSRDRISRLNTISFLWSDSSWDTSLHRWLLERSKPFYAISENVQNWITEQRSLYVVGDLDEWKIDQLQKYHFDFEQDSHFCTDGSKDIDPFVDHIDLASKEDDELIEMYQSGNKLAADTMLERHHVFVTTMVRRVSGEMFDMDLVQVGLLAMSQALLRFDLTRNIKWTSYIGEYIKGYVKTHLSDNRNLIRTPVSIVQAGLQISRFQKQYFLEYNSYPTEDEICSCLSLTPSVVQNALSAASLNVCSVNQSSDDDFKEIAMPDDMAVSVQQIIDSDFSESFWAMMGLILSDRELDILSMRFGRNSAECLSMELVGEKYGISRQRVQQIEVAILRKLSQSDLIREYDQLMC